jgi:hypothetical protein
MAENPATISNRRIYHRRRRGLPYCSNALEAGHPEYRKTSSSPPDPKFISSWRDFEKRFEIQLLKATFGGLISKTYQRSAERDWNIADGDGAIAADLIEKAIQFASFQAQLIDPESEEPLEDYSVTLDEAVELGVGHFRSLTDKIGLDLHGIFRRRNLIPFVLFPRHVAARHSPTETSSIYEKLQQAYDAFVFGVPFAALALMRSILEIVLREHYGADGENLSECISNSSKRLPKGVAVAPLHRLRRVANSIPHLGKDSNEESVKIDPNKMEQEIVSLLLVLRALIEGVPQRRAR